MSNKRLEDIYIGILASIFSIPINDISSHCVSFEHKDIEAKSFFLLENGIDNTAFIWESKEFDYFWNVILGFYKNRESVVKIPNILERFYYSFVYRLFLNIIKLTWTGPEKTIAEKRGSLPVDVHLLSIENKFKHQYYCSLKF